MATPVAEMICAAALPAVKQLQNTPVSRAGEMGSICRRRMGHSIFSQGPAEEGLKPKLLGEGTQEKGTPLHGDMVGWLLQLE